MSEAQLYVGYWESLRQYLKDYKEEKSYDYETDTRYCVALSIDDLLEKMDEIEGK